MFSLPWVYAPVPCRCWMRRSSREDRRAETAFGERRVWRGRRAIRQGSTIASESLQHMDVSRPSESSSSVLTTPPKEWRAERRGVAVETGLDSTRCSGQPRPPNRKGRQQLGSEQIPAYPVAPAVTQVFTRRGQKNQCAQFEFCRLPISINARVLWRPSLFLGGLCRRGPGFDRLRPSGVGTWTGVEGLDPR